MSEVSNDGGPAFARPAVFLSVGGRINGSAGMSYRAFAAAVILSGLVVDSRQRPNEAAVKVAVQGADLLIKELGL